jgi:ribonuclease BN (tRNA processing enzyme)
MIKSLFFTLFITVYIHPVIANQSCDSTGVHLQVLGSGGPENGDKRASSGYLIWQDGKARVLVDMGPGSALRFEESGAKLNDVDVILLSHLHVDHSADLPTYVKASFFTKRSLDLPLYGPTANKKMPATTQYVQSLLGPSGAFKYLSSYLDGSDTYQLQPYNVDADLKEEQVIINKDGLRIAAIAVNHGPIPALAWRVELRGKAFVFSGDMSGKNNTLTRLAQKADILVAHHAIPEGTKGIARNLHMPPSVIGKIAAEAEVKQLVLSHRMLRTLGEEQRSSGIIRKIYKKPFHFAEDLQCFSP